MNNVIISDVHGVLADLHTAWLKVYNEESGDCLTPEKITAWDIGSFVLPGWKDRLWEIYEREYLPGLVQPIQYAQESIVRMRELGWRILFVTSPSNNENPYRWYRWLEYHKFIDTMNDFFPARDKTVFRADIIVDDKPETIEKYRGVGIIFSQPWNTSFPWYARAKDWKEVLKLCCCGSAK